MARQIQVKDYASSEALSASEADRGLRELGIDPSKLGDVNKVKVLDSLLSIKSGGAKTVDKGLEAKSFGAEGRFVIVSPKKLLDVFQQYYAGNDQINVDGKTISRTTAARVLENPIKRGFDFMLTAGEARGSQLRPAESDRPTEAQLSSAFGGGEKGSGATPKFRFEYKDGKLRQTEGNPVEGIEQGGYGQDVAPQGTTYDESGKMVFNTGNSQLDEFLNNTYLPLLEAELGGDPNAIFDSEMFANIKERVDKAWGPIFEKELKMATDTFDLSKEGITAEQEKLTGDVAKEKTRLGEDVATQKQRIARSFSEAQEESKLAMAARKLTFGGARKKESRKLETAKGEQIGDLEKAQKRTLEDLTGEEKYGTGQLGRQMTGLEQGFANTKSEIEGERTIQYGAEKERLRTLGGSLLQNPEFMPQ